MPPTISNIPFEEKAIEGLLKDRIGGLRKKESDLATTWDGQLGYLLSTALANYETERIGGFTFAADEF